MLARDLVAVWACVLACAGSPSAWALECARDAFLLVGGVGAHAKSGGVDQGGGGAVALSEAQILALPVATVITATDWTPESRFQGPLLSDVVTLVASSGKKLEVLALNNYSASIPWDDLTQYGPILAYMRDGERLSRDRFGPLFIIYPRDRYPVLRAPSISARMVWQVCRIDVQ